MDQRPEVNGMNARSEGRDVSLGGRTKIRCPKCSGGTWKEDNDDGYIIYCYNCGYIVETYKRPPDAPAE